LWIQQKAVVQVALEHMESANAEASLYAPDERLLKPLSIPKGRLLTGPGPSNLYPRVLQAASLPLLGHMHAETLEVMSEITAGLQYLFQTTNSLTLAVSGTGHAGMEASLVNLLEDGDRVMVLKNGLWGERAKEVAERCGKWDRC
jgi:alanine-glyoxylate transaminase/serine-glyoxylate transaminase/serine-pyruvate transaminase